MSDVARPQVCQQPEWLGGCDDTDLVPVSFNDEVIGWLCRPHALKLTMMNAKPPVVVDE